MVKTAIIGASGFVGRHLFKKYLSAFPDTVGTSFSQSNPALHPFDIRRPDLAALKLQSLGVQSLLITSAKPNIAYCERNPDAARAVNVEGMLELIRQAVNFGIQPIFFSSDYVFDGRTGNYDDDAPTHPAREYGRQKQAVENELPRLTDNYLILRLSKIYGTQKGDGTLLDDLAKSLQSGAEVCAATDQIFSPTHVDDLVNAIVTIQERGLCGTINVCAPEAHARYEVAVALARSLGLSSSRVTPVSLHDLPGMSSRPLNTNMRSTRLAKEVGAVFTPLQVGVETIAAQWQ